MYEDVLAGMAIFSASVSAASLYFSTRKYVQTRKDDQKLRLAELLAKFQGNLEDIQQRQLELANLQDCRRYANDYLNEVNRLAYLNKREILDNEILMFFKWNFGYALTLIEWKKLAQETYNPSNVIQYLVEWIYNNKIEMVPIDRLPPLMLKFYNQWNNSSIHHAYRDLKPD